MKKFLIVIFVVFQILSCSVNVYKLDKNAQGITLVPVDGYTLNNRLSDLGSAGIDTTSLYVQIFELSKSNEDERRNPRIYEFHNDGFYKINGLKYFFKFDSVQNKKSAYYGRYEVSGHNIKMEQFYPASGSTDRYFNRVVSYGTIVNDTLTMNFFKTEKRYVRRTWKEVFGDRKREY